MSEEQQLRLGRPKYRVTLLPPPPPPPPSPPQQQQADLPAPASSAPTHADAAPSSAAAPSLALVGPTSIFQQAWGGPTSASRQSSSDAHAGTAAGAQAGAHALSVGALREAAAAAHAFRAVAAYASGTYDPALHGAFPPPPAWAHGSAQDAAAAGPHDGSSSSQQAEAATAACPGPGSSGAPYGPWRPFLAPVRENVRLTSADHFQDTRHIDFDLRGSGLTHEPGDLLAVLPM